MSGQPPALLFVSLAMNQARFFGPLAEAMAARGHRVGHIAFHQGSARWLQKQGQTAFDAFTAGDVSGEADPAAFGVTDLSRELLHERVYFDEPNDRRIGALYRRFLGGVAAILENFSRPGERVVLVQELGGFISVLAAFRAARARSIDCLFIEPAFYRGRIAFTANTLSAPAVAEAGAAPSPEVRDYLDRTAAAGTLVIPKKDSHHFRSAGAKLRDRGNMRRLVEKIVDKYILRRREVFDRIGLHVTRHVGMWRTSRGLRPLYRGLPEAGERFVYYPLHVPTDVALTIRSPECLDQYALLERIARLLPPGVKLAVKEHPALVGAVDGDRMRELAARHPGFVMLEPTINNYQVMRAAAAVVTVNSKSGAEALLLGRRVIVLGDAFYRPSRLVRRVRDAGDDVELREALRAALDGNMPQPEPAAVASYFQAVWDRSRPGELYDPSPENITEFAESLAAELAWREA